MNRPGAILLAAALWLQPLAAMAQLPADGQLAIIDLGALVKPAAINNVGKVVGQNAAGRAFFWDETGGMLDLGTFGGAESFANDINDSGVVVGWSQDAMGVKKAFRWDSANGMANLDAGLEFESVAESINGSGDVVGWRTNGTRYGSVRWEANNPEGEFLFTGIEANQKAIGINDDGAMVGLLLTSNGAPDETYYWTGSGSSSLFDGQLERDYVVIGINNASLTAGSRDAFSTYLQIGNEVISLIPKIADDDISRPHGINNLGQIVGASGTQGYIFDEGRGSLFNANHFQLISADPAGPQFDSVSLVADINNAQLIVGRGAIDGVEHGFIARPPAAGFIYQVGLWNSDADGIWSEPSNWRPIVPRYVATASSGPNITAPRTVAVDVPIAVSGLEFDSTSSYTIGGNHQLTLHRGGGLLLKVVRGSHLIRAPIKFDDNVVVAVEAADAGLSIAGAVDAPDLRLTKIGPGSFAIGQARLSRLDVNEGTVVLQFAQAASVLTSLFIASDNSRTARLDLTTSAAVVDYSLNSPIQNLRRWIVSGRGGAGFAAPWNGNGITSSAVAAANATEPESRSIGYAENSALPLGPYTTFRGEPVDETAVIIAYTRTGDANLDGVVNDDDVTIVGAMYAPGVPNPHWALGDFDYNGFVDDDDVTLLGVFYDPTAQPIGAPPSSAADSVAVPEPTAITLTAVAGLLIVVGSRARRVCLRKSTGGR